MKALTLIQPWGWAVAYGGKDVENRTWKPTGITPTEYVAIHAGRGWDAKAFAWLRVNAISLGIPLCPPRDEHHAGKIVAVCQVPGFFEPHPGKDPNPWFENVKGNHGWNLHNVMRLPDPVECRGMQGLFEIPEGVEGAVRLSLDRRRACFSCARAREQRHGPPCCPLRDDPSLCDAGGCAGWRPRPDR